VNDSVFEENNSTAVRFGSENIYAEKVKFYSA
jgi:hypothetical protein